MLTNPISEINIREMRNNMDDSDIQGFDEFVERNWGIKPPRETDYEETIQTSINTQSQPKKRGRKPKTMQV